MVMLYLNNNKLNKSILSNLYVLFLNMIKIFLFDVVYWKKKFNVFIFKMVLVLYFEV